MRRVIIESPYAGDIGGNVLYALQCMEDSLARGEAPFASHLIYTHILDDQVAIEREKGIAAGLAWAMAAELTAVYTDNGISPGMKLGITNAEQAGRPIEYRRLTDVHPG